MKIRERMYKAKTHINFNRFASAHFFQFLLLSFFPFDFLSRSLLLPSSLAFLLSRSSSFFYFGRVFFILIVFSFFFTVGYTVNPMFLSPWLLLLLLLLFHSRPNRLKMQYSDVRYNAVRWWQCDVWLVYRCIVRCAGYVNVCKSFTKICQECLSQLNKTKETHLKHSGITTEHNNQVDF